MATYEQALGSMTWINDVGETEEVKLIHCQLDGPTAIVKMRRSGGVTTYAQFDRTRIKSLIYVGKDYAAIAGDYLTSLWPPPTSS